jgi:hypothetical protein
MGQGGRPWSRPPADFNAAIEAGLEIVAFVEDWSYGIRPPVRKAKTLCRSHNLFAKTPRNGGGTR